MASGGAALRCRPPTAAGLADVRPALPSTDSTLPDASSGPQSVPRREELAAAPAVARTGVSSAMAREAENPWRL
uniref:Uncharacterized protein n=1 Tax=Setaria viridis TaxID=4556 RepID=A0A4U6U4D4_SETVI|nr:hypothetical protein SEVIR_6G076750v2 [Setaria viridis]